MAKKKTKNHAVKLDTAYQAWAQEPDEANTIAFFNALIAYSKSLLWSTFRVADDDIVDIGALLAFEKASSFEGRALFSTWARSVLSHKHAREVRKKRKRERREGVSLDAVLTKPALESSNRELLDTALDSLDGVRKKVVEQTLEGATFQETAAALGIPRDTAYWHWREALKQIAEMFKCTATPSL